MEKDWKVKVVDEAVKRGLRNRDQFNNLINLYIKTHDEEWAYSRLAPVYLKEQS